MSDQSSFLYFCLPHLLPATPLDLHLPSIQALHLPPAPPLYLPPPPRSCTSTHARVALCVRTSVTPSGIAGRACWASLSWASGRRTATARTSTHVTGRPRPGMAMHAWDRSPSARYGHAVLRGQVRTRGAGAQGRGAGQAQCCDLVFGRPACLASLKSLCEMDYYCGQ